MSKSGNLSLSKFDIVSLHVCKAGGTRFRGKNDAVRSDSHRTNISGCQPIKDRLIYCYVSAGDVKRRVSHRPRA